MTQAISRQELAWEKLQEEFQGTREILTPQCPACYSMKGQWRGYRRTKKTIVHRRWCTKCGRWFIGRQHIGRISHEDTVGKERLLLDNLS